MPKIIKKTILILFFISIISIGTFTKVFSVSCETSADCNEPSPVGCLENSVQCLQGQCHISFSCNQSCWSWGAWSACDSQGYRTRQCIGWLNVFQIERCGSSGGGSPPECDWQRADCPAGTRVDYNQEVGRFCGRISYCPNAGTAQRNLGCCGGGWVDTDDCWITPGGVKRCEQEYVCRRNNIATYRCVPIAPPVDIEIAMISNGDTMGCSAVAGYVGKNSNNILRVTSSIQTSFGGGTITDMRNWFGNNPASTDTVSNTISQALDSNGQFGIMVRKSGNNWTNIYAPSKYDSSGTARNNIRSWVRIGTVGSGYRGEIKGANGRSLASISNVEVTTSGANTVLTYEIAFYSDASGLQSYQSAVSKVYQIHGAAKFSNSTSTPNWADSGDTFVLDLTSPTQESLDFVIASNNIVNISWRFTDVDPAGSNSNGMARVIGNASRIKVGRVEGPIDDLTSGVLNYVLGSGGTDLSNLYTSTNNLWRVNGGVQSVTLPNGRVIPVPPEDRFASRRTERIDIKTNEGGSINFAVYAFDKACNRTLGNLVLPLGDPWIITKAGIVYSEGGSLYETPTLSYSSATERLSNDNYWNLPFSFYKSDADVSTEILGSSGSNLSELINSVRLKSGRLLNEKDMNNKTGYWFSRLSQKLESQIEDSPVDFVVVTNVGNMTAPARSTLVTDGTNTCANDRFCVVEVSGNLTVNSGYVCDARTLFVVEGTTTINPDITSNSTNNGCMFLNRGNVVISQGTYKSTGAAYPKYDILESLIITDGAITVTYGDSGQVHRDGLKVTGSLIGFGGSRSIEVERSLTLMDANNFPSVAVHFDARYLNFATKFFGGDTEGFKSEVGFKP